MTCPWALSRSSVSPTFKFEFLISWDSFRSSHVRDFDLFWSSGIRCYVPFGLDWSGLEISLWCHNTKCAVTWSQVGKKSDNIFLNADALSVWAHSVQVVYCITVDLAFRNDGLLWVEIKWCVWPRWKLHFFLELLVLLATGLSCFLFSQFDV